MIADHPSLGTGQGMGIPIAALVVLGWVAIFATQIYGVRHRSRDLIVPISAVSVAMLAILHSLVADPGL
jgi:hypothetical protein